ncbi:MAG: TraR/DksA family transcriptional regulator [Nitrospirota bacterium]|nr:TraR/DksA family transcriptional regulator [Nitrospirota bacterium]
MDDTEIEQYRAKLVIQKAELEALEASAEGTTGQMDLENAIGGRSSVREAMQAHLAANEASRRRQRRIQKIGGALRRIESGAYGNCFICGAALEADRLDQDQTITRCVNCIEDLSE